MMVLNILIPYNFTSNDAKSIDFVKQRYNPQEKLNMTLFHAYSPSPLAEIDTRNNPIMEKIRNQTSYLRARQIERKNTLLEIRQGLVDHGFNGDHINCLFIPIKHDIVTDIIKLTKSKNFNVIILNRKPGNILNYFTRSVSKRLIQYFGRETTIHIVN